MLGKKNTFKKINLILLFVIPLVKKKDRKIRHQDRRDISSVQNTQTMRSLMSQMLLVSGDGKRKQCLGSQMQPFVSKEQLVMRCSY